MPATPSGPTCGSCGQAATHGHQRPATDAEATQYLANMDGWRANQGLDPMPDNAAIRHAEHTVAVHTCCTHRPDDHAPCDTCPDPT